MIKRRDNKGRILHNGEIQLSDGKYRFKYVDSFGSERFIYSWRLDRTDIPPAGKRNGPSLRELEKQVQLDGIENSCLHN